MINQFIFTFLFSALKCGFPGAPAHSTVEFSTPTVEPGTVARYTCDRGFELLGPARRMCGTNGTWVPQGIPFCGKYKLSYFSFYSRKAVAKNNSTCIENGVINKI